MKYFEKAIDAIPPGSKLFVSFSRISKILEDVFPDETLSLEESQKKIEELFTELCKKFDCTASTYVKDGIEGMLVIKDDWKVKPEDLEA